MAGIPPKRILVELLEEEARLQAELQRCVAIIESTTAQILDQERLTHDFLAEAATDANQSMRFIDEETKSTRYLIEVRSTSTEVAKSEAELAVLETQQQTLKKQEQTLGAQRLSLQTKIAKLEKTLHRCQAANTGKEQKPAELQTMLERLHQQIAQLEQRLLDAQAKQKAFQPQSERIAAQIADERAKIALLEESLARATEQVKSTEDASRRQRLANIAQAICEEGATATYSEPFLLLSQDLATNGALPPKEVTNSGAAAAAASRDTRPDTDLSEEEPTVPWRIYHGRRHSFDASAFLREHDAHPTPTNLVE